MTPPERRLWSILKARPAGFKFRRQHGFGAYTLDFFCHEAAVAVEIDGLAHELGDNPERDDRHDAWVAEQGIITLRFRALDIRDNVEGVVASIVEACATRSPQEHPTTTFGGPPPLQMQGRKDAASTDSPPLDFEGRGTSVAGGGASSDPLQGQS